jgi:hypothetical protein
VLGAVIVFKVVANLGGAATTTLVGVAVSTLGAVGTGDMASGWADMNMIAVSCWIADRCFILALAVVGMVPPSCSNMLPAACRVLSGLDKTGLGNGWDRATKCQRNGNAGSMGCKNIGIGSDQLWGLRRSHW